MNKYSILVEFSFLMFISYASWTLAREYGFTDIDGTTPHWGDYITQSLTGILDRGGPRDPKEKFWLEAWYSQLKDEAAWRPLMEKLAKL